MKKRLLSLCLTAALCLTLLPTAAWAEEADPPDGQVVETSGSDDTEKQDAAAEADEPEDTAPAMQKAPSPTAAQSAENVAEVTSGGEVTYYDTFDSALFYATLNDGCTLKLLADVTGTTVMINNPFIFDLNGHSVDALSVDARATIKDSGTEKGKIGKVTVSNDKVPGLTLGGLLEEGYAFKYGNGYWANDSYLQTTEGSFVTVEKAPIQSVNVYANDKNNQKILTIAYGATGEVTLVSSCKLSETSGENLSCAWYKLTDDTAIPPLEGAAGTSYKLPADLPAGTYTYRVTFTSDYYSKSADITITVEKIDLANATVTIEPWHADGKFRFSPFAPELFKRGQSDSEW